ncbi:MAG: dipeptide ABC transporter ATP-binding protein [Lacrimispora sp.]|uniref:ABC transporter ATP-binding protein n=1 Tax=Lacrimispora sp. TaxID=2719234 RepID=UPI0039E62B7B
MKAERNKILEVKNLKKFFYGRRSLLKKDRTVVKAVNDVSFSIAEGETFGIVGESGCGKSTLGRSVVQLLKPTEGKVMYKGMDLASLPPEQMRRLRSEIQIIFQDPYASLNPRMTVRELIQAPLDVFSEESADEKLEKVKSIMEKVGLREEYLSKYPHEFSGGQRQRIVIARALILDPKFIFCDEPVSALDVSVKAQVLNLMKDLQKEFKLTYLFISHDLSVVRFLCDKIAVMYLGKIVEIADKDELYNNPKHPYTAALLSAIPIPDVDVKREPILLEGDLPSPYNPPSGCLFHSRCKYVMERCKTIEPEMTEVAKEHCAACHLLNKTE